ncbi:hypothetical protein [Thermococcus sp. 21S9]|uniref:hypothetical protein n=1 Tax=Thermococcus sp. 21S9 TaxID=1638223 RepID=UPI00143C6D2A|nr:hypothetical protein [Thermococcus sp. 21S9]NJE55337.1 hypothetical protein [Thermococcus sp. 21S9]
MRAVRLLLVLLVVGVLIASGCTAQSPTRTPDEEQGATGTGSSSTPSVSTGTGEQTQTGETPAGVEEKPSGVVTAEVFNRTLAVNASLVPDSTFDCLSKAPGLIKAYYSAVKDEKNVSSFFDLSVVDEGSLVELHEALYRAVDFRELSVSEPNCSVISTNLVACSYHYSAVLVKDGQEKAVERDYITFLAGDSCKIVWTEEGK